PASALSKTAEATRHAFKPAYWDMPVAMSARGSGDSIGRTACAAVRVQAAPSAALLPDHLVDLRADPLDELVACDWSGGAMASLERAHGLWAGIEEPLGDATVLLDAVAHMRLLLEVVDIEQTVAGAREEGVDESRVRFRH